MWLMTIMRMIYDIVELFAEYFLCVFFSLGGILYRCTIGLNKETINHS